MCGISAIYGKNIKNKEFSVKRSLQAVEHRGYSLYEIRVLDTCVLGCDRLEIVDRPRAIQPQTNEDETAFVIFNGEIFNYKVLRKELLEKGHKFKTASDTEVLVHLWEEYKEDMIDKLDSEMFAFFIYDKKKNSFFAARDPYGVKPFYYSIDKFGNYHFASEIKQLVQFKEIDEVKFFPQGHYMLNGKLKQYHKIPKSSEKIKDETHEIILNLRKFFDEAIKKRIDTDLPVGVFFGGGVDSAAVLATAKKYHKDITAFTVGHPHSPDMLVAQRYCRENKIKLVTFDPPSEKELSELIPKIIHITESFEPNMIRQSVISYFISKLARENGFRIILCGEGPDEIFAGYPEFEQCKSYKEISQQIYDFIINLPRTQFQRVDRTSMFYTLEVRVPFFDTALADYSIKIPSELKVKDVDGKKITKWILREAMKDRLPDYIVNREKVVLSEGAGYKGNQLIGGLFYDIVKNKISDKEFEELKKEYAEWNITNKEVAYYFKIYKKYLYTKAKFNQERPAVNAIDSIREEKAERIAEQILDSIHIKKYMAEKPYKEEQIKKLIVEKIKNKEPVNIVGYWGVEKEKSGQAEISAFNNLKEIKNEIKKYYEKCEIVLILTDIHGKANEIKDATIKNYYNQIKKLSKKHGFKTILLSKIWKENHYTLEDVKNELEEKPKIWWQHFSLKKELLASAKKHHYGKNKELGAKLYALISKYDADFVAEKFRDSIFFTYNSSDWQNILPDIPTFYLWSIEKGKHIKPWHL